MRLLQRLLFILWYSAIGTVMSAQVMNINSSTSTGLDISLSSSSSNYNFYGGNTPVWGNLQSNGYVEYTLSASAGNYALQLYYSNGTSSGGAVGVTVSGAGQPPVSIPSTGGWGNFKLSNSTTLALPGGRSTLRLAAGTPLQPYNLAGILITPTGSGSTQSGFGNPLSGMQFYVNPYSIAAKNTWQGCYNGQSISKIAYQPQAVWFGDWNSDPAGDVSTVIRAAAASGTVPILTVYDIVNRDCGGYSSGGAPNAGAYQSWIQSLTYGIGNSRAVVILEPDSLTQYTSQSCLNQTQKNERLSLLQYALSMFQQHAPNAVVYLDGGPPNGVSASLMGPALVSAGISNAAGMAINVSNYESTSDSIAYGTQLSQLTGGKHFVVDTSRNGAGATWDHQWCNPPNRGLGVPSQGMSSGTLDGYLWVQNPGTSDGTCNGGPSAGQFSDYIACTLLQNSAF